MIPWLHSKHSWYELRDSNSFLTVWKTDVLAVEHQAHITILLLAKQLGLEPRFYGFGDQANAVILLPYCFLGGIGKI